jgi:hypothetical protein
MSATETYLWMITDLLYWEKQENNSAYCYEIVEKNQFMYRIMGSIILRDQILAMLFFRLFQMEVGWVKKIQTFQICLLLCMTNNPDFLLQPWMNLIYLSHLYLLDEKSSKYMV